jgi:CheY-like chemotaxis protein
MDIEMPEMNGFEATVVIRDRERHTGKRTPVVALTATGDPQRCRAAGMDGYIAKPLTAAALGEVIDQLDIWRPLKKASDDRRSNSQTHFVTATGESKSSTAPLA